jgi:hypothetical protein
LAAAAAVVAWTLATPALACDGHKGEATAAVAKAEEAKPATVEAKGGCAKATAAAETAAVQTEAKGGCAKATAAGIEKASAEGGKAGCAKAAKGGCAKKAAAATLAKAEEVKADETK